MRLFARYGVKVLILIVVDCKNQMFLIRDRFLKSLHSGSLQMFPLHLRLIEISQVI